MTSPAWAGEKIVQKKKKKLHCNKRLMLQTQKMLSYIRSMKSKQVVRVKFGCHQMNKSNHSHSKNNCLVTYLKKKRERRHPLLPPFIYPPLISAISASLSSFSLFLLPPIFLCSLCCLSPTELAQFPRQPITSMHERSA